jgi:hypothetical protein
MNAYRVLLPTPAVWVFGPQLFLRRSNRDAASVKSLGSVRSVAGFLGSRYSKETLGTRPIEPVASRLFLKLSQGSSALGTTQILRPHHIPCKLLANRQKANRPSPLPGRWPSASEWPVTGLQNGSAANLSAFGTRLAGERASRSIVYIPEVQASVSSPYQRSTANISLDSNLNAKVVACKIARFFYDLTNPHPPEAPEIRSTARTALPFLESHSPDRPGLPSGHGIDRPQPSPYNCP